MNNSKTLLATPRPTRRPVGTFCRAILLCCFCLPMAAPFASTLNLWAQEAAPAPPPLADTLPQAPAECTGARTKRLLKVCRQWEDWSAAKMEGLFEAPEEKVLPSVTSLLKLQQQCRAATDELLKLRTQFKDSPQGDPKRELIQNYLTMCEATIGLSGRLNYSMRDAIDDATYAVIENNSRLAELIDRLTEYRSGAGAVMLAFVLQNPDPATGLKPYPPAMRAKVLKLMAAARTLDVVPILAEFVLQRGVDPGVRLSAIEVLRHIGIPQDPHPLQDPSIDVPVVTAAKLLRVAQSTRLPAEAPAEAKQRREALIQWLTVRATKGVTGDTYRIGEIEVRAGDWFLMRNPSPFNLFTDIAPGLFTHVGVVTTMTDARGIRRFVVTDIPERGDRVSATNVDAYVGTTLHYLFLRHQDAQVNQDMAQAAADTIGNPTQFDLLFRTNLVTALKGKELKGKTVHTYCAGYLLLCAQQTDCARQEFFPISEYPPSELCQQNLKKLGVRLGEDYISPTGPLFSSNHEIVGGREPFYSPEREIQMAIFDHFGERMTHSRLTPSPDLFQSLRTKVAGLSRYNPWLARALAKANNVSPRMDLEAAAQAAAIIETLDEIANQARDDFRLARLVVTNTDAELAQRALAPDEVSQIGKFRRRHADLTKKFLADQITPRQLRIALVDYYRNQGREALNERFFPQ